MLIIEQSGGKLICCPAATAPRSCTCAYGVCYLPMVKMMLTNLKGVGVAVTATDNVILAKLLCSSHHGECRLRDIVFVALLLTESQ